MTREEAIQVLMANGLYYIPYGLPIFNMMRDALDVAIEALEAEPKWISVDNPPKVEKYGEVYILVTDGESITDGVATNWNDDDDEVEIHGRFPIQNKNIKWWMPLPKLPKGVEE